MPYKVVETKKGVFQLLNIKTKNYIKTLYKSKQSAVNAGLNFMRYRHEKGKVISNKLHTFIVVDDK